MALATMVAVGAAPVEGVVVAPPAVDGDVGEENMSRLSDAVREALGEAGTVEVASGEACVDAGCAATLGAESNATHVLTWEVAVEGRDFSTKLVLRSGETGEEVAKSERSCDICGVQEVSDMLAEQAAALGRRAWGAQPAKVRITSTPPGAKVWIDGQLVGVTPYEDEVAVGPHQLEVGKAGYLSKTRDLELVEGVAERMDLELQKDPGNKATPMMIGGAAAVALGVGFIATGATFVSLHHQPVKTQCSGDDVDPAGVCRLRYNGLPSGVPLLVVGLAGLATGVALLVLDRKKRAGSNKRAQVRPSVGGLTVRF